MARVMKNEIPLIIPNFNQLTYLVNLINWWNYYTNYARVIIIDNASTYKPLLKFYDYAKEIWKNVNIVRCKENNCGNNLTFLIKQDIRWKYEYYCISNPDIMPCPDTPENFIDILRHCISEYKFHHAGFGLRLSDLPDWIDNKKLIIYRQAHFYDKKNKIIINYEGSFYKGFRAPIDLTFAMYCTSNGGWAFPMKRVNWSNAIRIFQAYHLGWYIHPDTQIKEHEYYFKTAIRREDREKNGKKIKGVNGHRPAKFN